jgi:hypothetical protein
MKKQMLSLLFSLFCFIPNAVFSQSREAVEISSLVKLLNDKKATDDAAFLQPELQEKFVLLKKRLPKLVLSKLNEIGDPGSVASKVRSAIAEDLFKCGISFIKNPYPVQQMSFFGPMPIKDERQAPPFSLIDMIIINIPGHKDMVGVVSTILIPFGWDYSVFLYKYENERWNLLLVQQGYSNEKDDYLQENLSCLLVDGKAQGENYLVVSYNPPWPTSCWSSLVLLVLKPGNDAFHPKVIKKISNSYYRCASYKLSNTNNIVKLNYRTGDNHKDAAGFLVSEIDEYLISNGGVHKHKWAVSKAKIRSSSINLYFQDENLKDQIDEMENILRKKGFEVAAQLNNSYQKWPNTIQYFRDEDDELANYIGTRVYDVAANGWRLDELNLSKEYESANIRPGSIEIWLCYEKENEKLTPHPEEEK